MLIDTTLQMIYCTLSDTHDIAFSSIVMNSTYAKEKDKRKKKIMGDVDKGKKDNTKTFVSSKLVKNQDTEELYTEEFRKHTTATEGYHVPASFSHRIWGNIKSFKIAYDLFYVNFFDHINEENKTCKKSKQPKEDCVIQFILQVTEKSGDKFLFHRMLYQIALIFLNTESHEKDDFFPRSRTR